MASAIVRVVFPDGRVEDAGELAERVAAELIEGELAGAF